MLLVRGPGAEGRQELGDESTAARTLAWIGLSRNMMMTVVLLLTLGQDSGCADIGTAKAHADAFDLVGAVERLDRASTAGCASARNHAVFLRGWTAARDAYRAGGSPESLTNVTAAIAMLRDSGDIIAAFILQAAEAAAQSERESLALFIEQAVKLESARLSAELSAVPMITAHEAAGELWLQVHRYEDARRAYQRAAERLGSTPRIALGLARAAARLADVPEACRQYRTLVAAWNVSGPDTQEIVEARQFLRERGCTLAGK